MIWDKIIKQEEANICKNNDTVFIMNGDALKKLSLIKSNSIDLIFADPPYNIGKDFGNNIDKWVDDESYILWCQKWINECMRVLKDTGTMYFMSATQFMPFLDVFISQNYNVLSRIVWTYDSSGVQSKKIFGSLYEPILMLNKSVTHNYTFNYQDIMIEAKTGAKRGLIDYRKTPPRPYNMEKVPGNVWDFSRVRFKMFEYENHPTQKPESLLERIIKVSSNKGDIVLDPFSGTFTTLAVAQRLERAGIGIELNPDYCNIGYRRCGIVNDTTIIKIKERKTNNKSKKDHLQIALFT